MAVFGIPQGAASYPYNGIIRFGSDYGNQDFVVPMAKFDFFDAKGNAYAGGIAPTIYIRLGGTFNSTLSNGYQEATGIMGDPGGTSIFAGETGKALGRLGSSFIEGIQKQIVQGVAGATGYVASAGQSGKSQVEFLQRIMLNNFQQLIYQGPTFRRFQLPFNMKPTSKEEAKFMLDIISSFRVASSPRAGTETTINQVVGRYGGSEGDQTTAERSGNGPPDEKDFTDTGGKESPAYLEALRTYNSLQPVLDEEGVTAANDIVTKNGQVFTFGYPDMCKFELVLYRKKPEAMTTLFRSEFCMIETVGVDYGAQNKMTFFDGLGTNGNYYPTDVNLTISLRESVLITASKATEQFLSGTVLL